MRLIWIIIVASILYGSEPPKLTDAQQIERLELRIASLQAQLNHAQVIAAKIQGLFTDPEVVGAKAAEISAMRAVAAKDAELAKVCGAGKLQENGTCLMPEVTPK